MRKGEEVELASLGRRFEVEYGDQCARFAAELKTRYPDITRAGRRTGRALRNICFFVWCCCRDEEPSGTLVPALLNAAVLLSAQDDYYDNPRISASRKQSFCASVNEGLRTGAFAPDAGSSAQVHDLTALWSYVAGTIPRSDPRVRSYWIETACQLNTVMMAESSGASGATLTYEEYMRTATHSIGVVFIWATYFAYLEVPFTTLLEAAPVLVQGARVVRLSNDLASHRQRRKKESAVTLVGGVGPAARIRRLEAQEAHAFRQRVKTLDVEPHIRSFLLHSVDFLRAIYRQSDFDRGPVW